MANKKLIAFALTLCTHVYAMQIENNDNIIDDEFFALLFDNIENNDNIIDDEFFALLFDNVEKKDFSSTFNSPSTKKITHEPKNYFNANNLIENYPSVKIKITYITQDEAEEISAKRKITYITK